MEVIDLQSDLPRMWWTFDASEDLNSDYEVFGGAVWKCNRLGDYRLGNSYIAFDWFDDENTMASLRLEKNDDGLFTYRDPDESYEAAKSQTVSHTLLTGRWAQTDYGRGVFIAVFPTNIASGKTTGPKSLLTKAPTRKQKKIKCT